jgi:hypothetical protein
MWKINLLSDINYFVILRLVCLLRISFTHGPCPARKMKEFISVVEPMRKFPLLPLIGK